MKGKGGNGLIKNGGKHRTIPNEVVRIGWEAGLYGNRCSFPLSNIGCF